MYSRHTYLSIGRQSSSNLPFLGSKNLKPPVRHLVSTIKYHAPFRRGSLWFSIFPILPTTDLNDPDPRGAFCFTAEVRIRRSPCPNPWTCQPRHPPPIASNPIREIWVNSCRNLAGREVADKELQNSKYKILIEHRCISASLGGWVVLGMFWSFGLGTFEFWCCIISSKWQRTTCGNNIDHKLSILQIESIPSLALFKRWGAHCRWCYLFSKTRKWWLRRICSFQKGWHYLDASEVSFSLFSPFITINFGRAYVSTSRSMALRLVRIRGEFQVSWGSMPPSSLSCLGSRVKRKILRKCEVRDGPKPSTKTWVEDGRNLPPRQSFATSLANISGNPAII